ncbi:MAG: hypothetical protein K1X53_08290 [Candidatus Sumerlaeaceae bacterium]|nr:hypothetical protein [Candidatus Sumerlaeaceae bacterium]
MFNEDLTPVPDPFGDDISGLSSQPLPDPVWPDGPPADPRDEPDPINIPDPTPSNELVFYDEKNPPPENDEEIETVSQVLGQTICLASVTCRRLFHAIERLPVMECDVHQLTQRVTDVNAGIYALAQLYRLHTADETARRLDLNIYPRKRRKKTKRT